jgi:hypothetical protein
LKPRKIFKKIRKRIKKALPEPLEEIFEEAEDFVEEIWESVFEKRKVKVPSMKKVKLYGSWVLVRPAYVFAERIENFLKMVFGFSIAISAIIAAVWGFIRVSDILEFLINSVPGRIILIIIGFSYFMVGLWKMTHIKT